MKYFILTSLFLIVLFACNGNKENNNSTATVETDQETDTPDIHPSVAHYDTFPVHFCIVTNNDSVRKFVSVAQLKNEIDTMNKYFTAEDPSSPNGRRKLVHFKYAGETFYDEAKKSGSALVRFLDQERSYGGKYINELFDSETNRIIRHPNAINVYIYDSWLRDKGRKDYTCHGRLNESEPYLLIDYVRLGHIKAAEEHELGHGFGLSHLCDITIDSDTTPSNIMNSGRICDGRGGARNIGFDDDQVETIEKNSPLILEKLRLD